MSDAKGFLKRAMDFDRVTRQLALQGHNAFMLDNVDGLLQVSRSLKDLTKMIDTYVMSAAIKGHKRNGL